jgi:hypothetical protein|tara:strand:+ start:2796 stop:2906 length:111 start_codon:yes stop_codon:yes gene_type:complete
MYRVAAKNTGGKRRKIPCSRNGIRDPVLFVASARLM